MREGAENKSEVKFCSECTNVVFIETDLAKPSSVLKSLRTTFVSLPVVRQSLMGIFNAEPVLVGGSQTFLL